MGSRVWSFAVGASGVNCQAEGSGSLVALSQRAQYPLIQEYLGFLKGLLKGIYKGSIRELRNMA